VTTTVGGRYTLLERIGSGAMGVVWRARDEVLAREVAVKQLITGDHLRAMREARNAARLHHPHAIAVFDVVGNADEEPWIVMEYLPSVSLSALIAEKGPLAPSEAARIGGHVASALAAAHSAGLVHRDIKPGNVLIGHDGTVKITDFGISKATGDGTMTDTGVISGTPAYLSPEVARGENPDAASDVFSLGATIYTAIEGESVYGPSDNNFGLLYRAASGQVGTPKNAGELAPVLARLLAVDPKDRLTAQQAVALLLPEPQPSQPLPVVASEKTLVKPTKKRVKPPKPFKRSTRPKRRVLVVLTVVAMLAIGGSAAATYWNGLGGGGGTPTNQADFPTVQRPRYFTAEEAIAFVQQHYADLPGNPVEAWTHFSARAREPQDDFLTRWKGYTSVRCSQTPGKPVHSNGPDWIVTVDLALVTDLGKQRNITVEVSVSAEDNQMKISNLREI
jgi:serine/threonine protein kinase